MRCACLRGASRNALNLNRPHSRHNPSSIRPFIPTVSLLHDSAASIGQHRHQVPGQRGEPDPGSKSIAILGGGITGLSTAFTLLQTLPNANITIYEATNRLGGWINSEKIQVEGGEVVFEWGPRNLRPDLNGSGYATALLVRAHLSR